MAKSIHGKGEGRNRQNFKRDGKYGQKFWRRWQKLLDFYKKQETSIPAPSLFNISKAHSTQLLGINWSLFDLVMVSIVTYPADCCPTKRSVDFDQKCTLPDATIVSCILGASKRRPIRIICLITIRYEAGCFFC